MDSMLPISILILLSLSQTLLGSVLPEFEDDLDELDEEMDEPELPVSERRLDLEKKADVSLIRDKYNENRINPHTDDEIEAIVKRHNKYRKNVSPSASNMELMVCKEF